MKRTILIITMLTVLVIPTAFTWGNDIFQAVEEGELAQVESMVAKNPKLLNAADGNGMTPLNKACFKGETEIAMALLKRGADMNLGDCDGSKPIHGAAASGDTELFDYLVKIGADLHEKDGNSNSPLMFAAIYKQYSMMEHLLGKGAEVNTRNKHGWSPLFQCVIHGNKFAVELLMEKGADVNIRTADLTTPLHSAVSFGHTRIVRLLIENGADVNAVEDDGEPPICWARNTNCIKAARLLLDHGAEMNCKDATGDGPIHFAALNGSVLMLQFFLDQGAKVDAKNDEGQTPLLSACSQGRLEAAEFLVEQGADVNCENIHGWMALHHAALSDKPELMKLLLDRGSRLDPLMENAPSPLSLAISHGQPECAALLMEQGADIDATDQMGMSVLHHAVLRGKGDAVKMLLDKGAEVNRTENVFGCNELHTATARGFKEIVDMLLEGGVDPLIRDDRGKTPLDYALYHRFPEIAATLADDDFEKIESRFLEPGLVTRPVKGKEAVIWHLSHSGWAVKTENHLLIFDYWERPDMVQPVGASLASGYITPREIKDLDVTVFSTHEHADHYWPGCFEWCKIIPSIHYVLGHQPQGDLPDYTYLGPRQKKSLKGMKIMTIDSTDTGVGFMVQVDGLTIFHAGDHANGRADQEAMYKGEIDYLAGLNLDVDLAFFPITGCGLGDRELVKEGVYYGMKKLAPRLSVPMHSGDWTHKYREFVETAKADKVPGKMAYVLSRGDRFMYKKGKATVDL